LECSLAFLVRDTRVAGDLLQCVDSANPDIELLGRLLAELLDGPGEALGGLAPALQLQHLPTLLLHGAVRAAGLTKIWPGGGRCDDDGPA
jgi:hypothetical protein